MKRKFLRGSASRRKVQEDRVAKETGAEHLCLEQEEAANKAGAEAEVAATSSAATPEPSPESFKEASKNGELVDNVQDVDPSAPAKEA
jgi:hypothetical protein